MEINWIAIIISAITPFALGFVWYGPLFGKAWMKAAGMTEEQVKSGNMALIFGLSFIFNLLFAFFLNFLVIHQMHVHALLQDPVAHNLDPNSADGQLWAEMLSKYGSRYRTWTHGALHGVMTGIFFVLPIFGVTSLYERKNWKYIAINAGYWTVLLGITGAIICAWR